MPPLLCLTLVLIVPFARADSDAVPDWAREVRPVLADRCLRCHGPDAAARQAGLRLDVVGSDAITPGDADASLVIERVTAPDDDRMPPDGAGPALNAEEVGLLRRWIDAGARVEPHWSFVPPEASPSPAVAHEHTVRNDIDRFVLARLESAGLTPSPEADRRTLARRLALDLTGLPPDPDRVDAFARDERPDAYERLVDEYLADDAFGERWARPWLDLARYADTKGYEKDARRTIWPYRDWVIHAFNRDLPFDEFTIEQLAGDMLPNPTVEQRVATAFHRNTMSNDEGGTDDEEFRCAAVVDRVNTTMETWMGLTMKCAQCHTHKYDPITQEEFYRFYAYFNQTADADRDDEAPTLRAPSTTQRDVIDGAREVVDRVRADLDARGFQPSPVTWLEDAPPAASTLSPAVWPTSNDRPHAGATCWVNGPPEPGNELTQIFFEGASEPLAIGDARERLFAHVRLDPEALPRAIMLQFHLAGGDWEHRVFWGEDVIPWGRTGTTSKHAMGVIEDLVAAAGDDGWIRLEVAPETIGLVPGARVDGIAFSQHSGRAWWDDAGIDSCAEARQLADALGRMTEVEAQVPSLPVMVELEDDARRITRIHEKGSFLNPGAVVEPGLPALFGVQPDEMPRDRLQLARWIASRDNPLTARVFVNRVWAEIFGQGIVTTLEDFGTQGALPTHPELLDTLAVRFMDDGWSIKELIRSIVASATYRQSSARRDDLAETDPYNTWLGRAPRIRLSAEAVRDQALAVSGLLDRTVGGPPVFPPQPEGVWMVVYSGDRWMTTDGPDRYRRGLYTFWRRTSPYPSMVTFDAPSREFCVSRRVRTNTPLQALVTLNDPVYVEAAQALAERVVAHDESERIDAAFRLCLMRGATEREMAAMQRLIDSEMAHFTADREAARQLVGGVDDPERAAWIVGANVLLNLDAFLTKG